MSRGILNQQGGYSFLDADQYKGATEQLNQLNTQFQKFNSFKGTNAYDQKATDYLAQSKSKINQSLISNTLANNKGQSQNASGQKILTLARDSGDTEEFSQYVQSMGGWDALSYKLFEEDSQSADEFLGGFEKWKTDNANAASTAEAQAKLKADQEQALADAKMLADEQADGLQEGIDRAQAAISKPIADFDQEIARQFAGIQSKTAGFAKGAGFADAGAAGATAGAELGASAGMDRQAVASDARANADSILQQVFSDATNYQFDAANLDAGARAQLEGQSLDRLSQVIQAEIGTASEESKGQLMELEAAINEYKNGKLSEQQKKSLIKKIVGIGIGTVMAGAAGVLAATGVGAPVAAAVGAAGVGQIANAARS